MDESDLGGFISKKKSLGEFISKVSQIRVIGNGKVKMTHPGLERLC